MIDFNLNKETSPCLKVFKLYEHAKDASQKFIEAACLSTCDDSKTPQSRYVNIKYINDNELIFFSNYNSLKAKNIEYSNKISLVFFWDSINCQIRISGTISKLDSKRSDAHWKKRSKEKNILSTISQQSNKIKSYDQITKKFNNSLDIDVSSRPNYWGGYSISPYYFEIWEGHPSRINKREIFELCNEEWLNYYLEP